MKKKKRKEIESNLIEKYLIKGLVINILMGIIGILMFVLTNSRSILLDGSFSGLFGVLSIWAIVCMYLRSKGKNVNKSESIYVMVKVIVAISVILYFMYESIQSIFEYIESGPDAVHKINNELLIFIYGIVMIALCFGLAYFYKKKNALLKKESEVLKVERVQVINDGLISLGTTIGLTITLIAKNIDQIKHLYYIGDALIVIIFASISLIEPIHILFNINDARHKTKKKHKH